MTFTIAPVNLARGYRGGERQTELLIRELGHFDVRQILVARKHSPLAQCIQSPGLETRTVSGNHFGIVAAFRGVNKARSKEIREAYPGKCLVGHVGALDNEQKGQEFIIEAACPDQLQAAILQLCREPQLRLEMGERGSFVAKHFTASAMCEKYLKIYRSVLGQTD